MNKGDPEVLALAARELRQHLAHNVRKRMDEDPDIDTQGKLADRAGINQSTVSRLLRSENGLTLDQLAAVAVACGTVAYKLLLKPVMPLTHRMDAASEGQNLMDRLKGAPKEAERERNEAAKPRAAGVHSHQPKSVARKKVRKPQ